jgi:zinc-ribbon domain
MFCRRCGRELTDKDVFCASCGLSTNASIVTSTRSSPSTFKIALGVFLGILALVALFAVIGSIGVDGLVIVILAIIAILVASGAFRKKTR